MMYSALVLLLCGTSLASSPSFMNSRIGRYVIEVQQIISCDPQEEDLGQVSMFLTSVRRHYNHTVRRHLWDGSVFTNETVLPGKLQVHYDVAVWNSVAGWKKHYFVMNVGDPCVLMDMYWPVVQQHNKMVQPPLTRCPMLMDTYQIINAPGTFDDIKNFPLLPYGRFKANLKTRDSKNGATKSCLEFIIQIDPKRV